MDIKKEKNGLLYFSQIRGGCSALDCATAYLPRYVRSTPFSKKSRFLNRVAGVVSALFWMLASLSLSLILRGSRQRNGAHKRVRKDQTCFLFFFLSPASLPSPSPPFIPDRNFLSRLPPPCLRPAPLCPHHKSSGKREE